VRCIKPVPQHYAAMLSEILCSPVVNNLINLTPINLTPMNSPMNSPKAKVV